MIWQGLQVWLAVAALVAVIAHSGHTGPPAPVACPPQVVWNPLWSENPHGIGGRTGDRRRLTREDALAVLEAQLSDPYRHPMFDAELQREIARLKKVR